MRETRFFNQPYFSDGYNGQSWVRPKPGTSSGSLTWLARAPNSWAIFCCFSRSWIRNRTARTKTFALYGKLASKVGTLSTAQQLQPHVHSQKNLYLWICTSHMLIFTKTKQERILCELFCCSLFILATVLRCVIALVLVLQYWIRHHFFF